MEDKIILLIITVFVKIVSIIEIIMKKYINYNNGNSLNDDNAIIPTRASKEYAGLDSYSSIDVDIEVGSIKKVNTGTCISLPENSYGSIRDKSSLASKGLLTLGGVIDKDYKGEIIVIMTSLIEPIKIKKGQKIAQLIVYNTMYPEIKKVESLKDTARNNKGFGEMDKIDSIKKFSDEVFEYSDMYNYKI